MGVKIWATSQDGLWSVISSSDYKGGIGRSKTRPTPGQALKADWLMALVTPPGITAGFRFIKVRTMDLTGTTGLRPSTYTTKKGKRVIPPYPHRCNLCGGNTLELFSSVEHEGGTCPGSRANVRSNR